MADAFGATRTPEVLHLIKMENWFIGAIDDNAMAG
jgi:hypothetical protein